MVVNNALHIALIEITLERGNIILVAVESKPNSFRNPLSFYEKYLYLATSSKISFIDFFNLGLEREEKDMHPLIPPVAGHDWALDSFFD